VVFTLDPKHQGERNVKKTGKTGLRKSLASEASIAATLLTTWLSTLVGATQASAWVVDPQKVAVNIGQDPKADHDFVLAFDSNDKSIVYYAPKGGRVALMNGQPLVGFALLPDGSAVLNAQLEFGVFGAEKEALFKRIQEAGYTPVPFPFKGMKVKPLTPGIGEDGKQVCVEIKNEATGEMEKDCDPTVFSEVDYSRTGPTLGENVAITAMLNKSGGVIYKQFLRSGNALQLNLEAEYYKAGDAFTATVTVNYDKLFEQFHAYAAYHDGICTDVQMETFWKNAGLCVNKPASECAVLMSITDARGQQINNVTLDPEDENQKLVWQLAERTQQKLQDEMMTPLGAQLGQVDTTKPAYGFKLDAKYEKQQEHKHATFQFKSPRGVNIGTTVIPTGIACVIVSDTGDVSRNVNGDCKNYWSGSYGFADILAKQVKP
jgi:hypothetical protein